MTTERHNIRKPLPPRLPAGRCRPHLGLAVPGISHAAKLGSYRRRPALRRRPSCASAPTTRHRDLKHLEMGQGTYTGLATIVAEEPTPAWAQVKVEGAPADAKRYNNLFFGAAQGTGGSTAMANSWGQMRQTAPLPGRCWSRRGGAGTPAAEITVAEGVRYAASGRKATFGELARGGFPRGRAGPGRPQGPEGFRLIGKRAPQRTAPPRPTARRSSPRICTCPACWWRWSPIRRALAAR